MVTPLSEEVAMEGAFVVVGRGRHGHGTATGQTSGGSTRRWGSREGHDRVKLVLASILTDGLLSAASVKPRLRVCSAVLSTSRRLPPQQAASPPRIPRAPSDGVSPDVSPHGSAEGNLRVICQYGRVRG